MEAAWAGPAASTDAMLQGRAFFRDNQTTLQEWQEEFSKLSPSQKELFKLRATEAKIEELNKDSKVGINIAAQIALKRAASPKELKGLLLYLASDSSSYMTGATVIHDGGLSIC